MCAQDYVDSNLLVERAQRQCRALTHNRLLSRSVETPQVRYLDLLALIHPLLKLPSLIPRHVFQPLAILC